MGGACAAALVDSRKKMHSFMCKLSGTEEASAWGQKSSHACSMGRTFFPSIIPNCSY